ncbi:MAG: hypothetical protein EXR74_10065 [Bdellovibrionales bacterium]|nr:hypothetical protein [Bdellovibrionales bacterium]
MSKTYSAINIQFPISQLILSGQKSVETRTYPIPIKYIGVPLLIVETPGKKGSFKSRIVGLIRFDECFEYSSERAFYLDFKRHKVDKNSDWAWEENTSKWGWKIGELKIFSKPFHIRKRIGIKFTVDVKLPDGLKSSYRLPLTTSP